jgi:hypothetical protein
MTTLTSFQVLEDDFCRYLSVDELRQKLEILKNTDLSTASQGEITNTFFSYFDTLPSLIAMYQPSRFNNFYFYRARLNVDHTSEDTKLIRTFSYPLPQFCKDNGRANLRQKSVFYCSNCAVTSVMEAKPKVGDVGYLSVWRGNAQRPVKTGILLPRGLKQDNIWSGLTDDMYMHVDKELSTIAQQKYDFFKEEIRFVADLFLSEKPPYALTSWIGNELIYGTSWKDMIVYPSFVNDGYSCNVALHPNFADRFLEFEKVIRFKILDITDSQYVVSTGKVGVMVNNSIMLRDATKEELDFSLFPFTVEEKRQTGKVVETI